MNIDVSHDWMEIFWKDIVDYFKNKFGFTEYLNYTHYTYYLCKNCKLFKINILDNDGEIYDTNRTLYYINNNHLGYRKNNKLYFMVELTCEEIILKSVLQ